MTWRVCVAGSITLDDITTPHGRRADQMGGSAVYFALAAAGHAPVSIVGVVGQDAESLTRVLLDRRGVDVSGLEVAAGPTTRWAATHDFQRWVTASETEQPGVAAGWTPTLPPSVALAEVLFLGSMEPAHQLSVLRAARPLVVGSDSMTVYIAAEPQRVLEVIAGSDVLFLNRAELAALTGSGEQAWLDSARSLIGRGRLRVVVVKAGPNGAAAVTADRVVARDPHMPSQVVDPTGAGDALAGGFLGACAAAERDPVEHLDAALEAGLVSASRAIAAFGPAQLCG